MTTANTTTAFILIADDPRYGETTAFTGWDAIQGAFRTMWGMSDDELDALRDQPESESHIYEAEFVSAGLYETTPGTRYHVGKFSEDGMAEASESTED